MESYVPSDNVEKPSKKQKTSKSKEKMSDKVDSD